MSLLLTLFYGCLIGFDFWKCSYMIFIDLSLIDWNISERMFWSRFEPFGFNEWFSFQTNIFFFEFFCISMFNLIYFLSLFQIYSRKNIDKYTHNCTYFNIKSLLFMHLGIMGKNFIYSILNFLLFFSSFFLILEQISFRHSDDV